MQLCGPCQNKHSCNYITISHCLSKYFVAEYVKLDFHVLNSQGCMQWYSHLFRHQEKNHFMGEIKKDCSFLSIKQSKIKHGKVKNFHELIGFYHPLSSSLLGFQAYYSREVNTLLSPSCKFKPSKRQKTSCLDYYKTHFS